MSDERLAQRVTGLLGSVSKTLRGDEGADPPNTKTTVTEDEPGYMKGATESGTRQKAGSWIPYEGPRGGSGWVESGTGRKVYEDEPPGEPLLIGDMDPGTASPLTHDTDVEPGGLLVSPDGDKAAVVQANTAFVKVADPSGETERVGRADLVESGVEYAPPTPGGDDTASAGVTDTEFGTDFSGVDVEGGYKVASDDTVQAVERTLRKEHGNAAVGEMTMLRGSWKTSSYSSRARGREEVFKEALGLNGDIRNHGLETDMEGTDAVHGVARDTTEASRRFMRENYADENGNIEVHRGLSRRVGADLQTQLFSRVGSGDDGDVSINLNAMDNYSVDKDIAGRWGGSTATITEERPVDDVVVATDMLMDGSSSEGEVTMTGGVREIAADDIDVFNTIPANELVQDPSEHDDMRLRQITTAASEFLNATNDDKRYDRGKYPDVSNTLGGIERIAEEARERADASSEANEEAVSAAAEAIDVEGEYARDALSDKVREDISGSDWAEISIGITGRGPEEVAEDAVDTAKVALDDDEFDQFMRNLTGETFSDISNIGLGTEVEELEAAIEQADRLSEDQKADGVGGSYDIDGTADPVNIDWLAMAGDGKDPDDDPADPAIDSPAERKSWIPYEGPRGGQGWKNTDTGRKVYDDEPPGETAASTLEDDPLSKGDKVVLRYDGETHHGEVIAETPRDVRVRDDRNLWTLDKDQSEQYGGDMELVNLGAPESDREDPSEMEPETAEELSYAVSELELEDAADKVVDSLGQMSVDEAIEGIKESNKSILLMGDEAMRRSSAEVDGLTVAANADMDDAMEMRDVLEEEYDRYTRDDVVDMSRGWEGAMYRAKNAAPMIQAAVKETGNETMPEYRDSGVAADMDVDGSDMRSAREASEFTTEKLREAFGDEVTVFRGFSNNPHGGTASEGTAAPNRLREGKEEDEPVEIEHRPVESWTLEPNTAKMYAGNDGAVAQSSVPVEEVAMSSSVGTIHPSENDTVLEHDGPQVYDPSQIYTGDELREDDGMLRLRLEAARGMKKND